MNATRITRLIIWLILMIVAIYFRFYSVLYENAAKIKIIHTLLSLSIMLLGFRIIIDLLVILYKIDRKAQTQKMRDNLIVGISNLFSIFSVIAVGLGLLSILGLNPIEVFTSLSIVAAAIAIISKEFITEIIIGIYNGFSTKIELDDYVKVGEQRGKILDIGLQKITLQNDDDDMVYIPNLTFYNAQIINYTKKDLRKMSIEFTLDIKYIQDLEKLEVILCNGLDDYENYVEHSSGAIKIIEIGKDFIDLKFQYTLKQISRDIHRSIRKTALRSIADYVVDNSKNVRFEK